MGRLSRVNWLQTTSHSSSYPVHDPCQFECGAVENYNLDIGSLGDPLHSRLPDFGASLSFMYASASLTSGSHFDFAAASS